MSCDFFLIGKKVTHRFPSRSRGTYYGGRLFSSSCYYAAAIATVPILQLYTYMCVCYRYCYVLLLFVFNFTNHFFCESGKVLIFSVFSFLVKKISSKIASLPFARRCFLARYCSMTSSCLFSAAFSFISLIFTCSSRKRLCPFIGFKFGNFSTLRGLSNVHSTFSSIAFLRNSATRREENSGFRHFLLPRSVGIIASGSFARCSRNLVALRYILLCYCVCAFVCVCVCVCVRK